MGMDLRQLRCLVAVVDHGGFTDAAADLGVSQPAVSRGLAALESELGVRLLRRTSRQVVPTAVGERVLIRARRLLADVEDLAAEARGGVRKLRIGHAWAAVGAHTVEFQRRWAAAYPDTELHLVRHNSPTGGLAEGACDIAIVRTPHLPDNRFDDVTVGLEARYCALAADDRLTRHRLLRLSDLADRTLAVDPLTGTTTASLWPRDSEPPVEMVHDVDDWLAVIAAGRCIGVTTESTLTQYRRQGVVFRRLRDAPPVPVRLLWWRDDPTSALSNVIDLLVELYRSESNTDRPT
jgi:DNA-binding transcriptional LysR family regulator